MRYILITGCSDSSIGAALAVAFSSHPNLHIIATSRATTSMSTLSTYPNITLLSLDVTSASSVSTALSAVKRLTNGKLDYLLNYAGCGYTMPYADTDMEVTKKMYDVNVFGAMRVTQAFLPLVLEAKGTVVMAGSTAELLGFPFQGAYCGSKAALWAMTESLRVELRPFGVKVLHVTTGNILSNWFSNNPEFNLPADSIYQPIKKEIEIRAQGKHDVKWMKADVYAERVVGDILAGKNGRVYRGEMATLARFVVGWLPLWLLDRVKAQGTGLDKLG